jgi:hypothetical protein
MKLGTTLAVSVFVNLALGGVAVRLWRQPGATKPPPNATGDCRIEQMERVATAAIAGTSPSSAAVVFVTNRFDWSKAESENWETLAASLRAVGCPEKTICDLLFARARRAVDRVERRDAPVPFWTSGVWLARAAEERDRSCEADSAKIRAALRRAVGVEFDPLDGKPMRDFEEQAISRFVIGPLPEEKFQRLVAIMRRFSERGDAVHARCQGVELDEDLAEMKQLEARYAREVSALLTREQYEEFKARCAMMSHAAEVKWEATDLTPAEVRQIALIRGRVQVPAFEIFDASRSTADKEDHQIQGDIRAFLGDRRAAEFERAADGSFQRLFEFGKDQDLSREAVVKAYDIRKLAEQEAAQVRDDKILSAAQRRQRLEQMQAEAQEAMLKTLGATACQQYLQHGGEWVTNFTKL